MPSPPEAPTFPRRLVFPPRRIAAITLLAALPLASLVGTFEAEASQRVSRGPLTLSVRYPARTLYRENVRLEVALLARDGCERAQVDGLDDYLAAFEEVRIVPTPPTSQRLYDGRLTAGERVALQVHARPASSGLRHATVRLICDRQQGPQVTVRTFVFP